MTGKIKVLIVDDSALMRQLLARILATDPEIEVIGTAGDPFVAREKIKALNPDVLTLDIEMPRMDGITFLDKLMRGHPMPVVMISSLTEKNADVTLRALGLGAVDFVSKPKLDVSNGTIELAEEIVCKVKSAAHAKLRYKTGFARTTQEAVNKKIGFSTTHKVVAIGSSTGGTEALKELLVPLPADFPGIVIVQHMPEAFTRPFAERLNSLCHIHVQEAKDGDRILQGHALLAPGGHQMEVRAQGMEYSVHIYRGQRVNRHMPSVDVLFHSCARQLGKNVLSVLLTGMGSDGAQGMLAMRQSDAFTIAQDEASCVVFGMPKEAIRLGAAQKVLPLSGIGNALMEELGRA
ncbi:protein-glutamate methylesterase/protein-glutamine glutaminase [Telmatobacter bradus]|uniref:protein-glutamate methylesterase/protein-glutamine glutaminase n=1 Tax=Telmatobacter bradus TaxID=474953 RepID=UPI003B437EC0